MKAYENVKVEVLQLKEDIVRTSGEGVEGVEAQKNNRDTIIFDFGI